MGRAIEDMAGEAMALAADVEELRDGLSRLPALAAADPEAGLMRVRKLLEFLVRDLYTRRFGEPAGTRPLENLLQRMARENYLPRKLGASANLVRELGNLGVHSFGESVTATDVEGALAHLIPLLAWYREEVGPSLAPRVAPTSAAPAIPATAAATPVVPPRARRLTLAMVALAGLVAAVAWGVSHWRGAGRPRAEPARDGPGDRRSPFGDGLAATPALRVLLEGQPEGNRPGVKTRLGLKIVALREGAGLASTLADGDMMTSADTYHLEVEPGTPGYLYVFQVDTAGTLTVLHPALDGSPFSRGANPVSAWARVRVPPGNDLRLDENVGIEHVFCVLSTLRWEQLERALSDAEAHPKSGAPVEAPFRVTTRGVAGLVPVGPPEPGTAPTGHYEGNLGFIVVGRWFRHMPRR